MSVSMRSKPLWERHAVANEGSEMMATMKPVVEVRIERLISAPRSSVYRAWLEPEILRRWLAPGSMEVSRVEVEERVGGYFRIWQTHNAKTPAASNAD